MNCEIDVRHLRYFVRVAEELHFGRAAEQLGMAQAPLSQQIRQLEERVGTRLFERTTRNVKLTDAGTVFLQHALGVLADLSDAVVKTRAAANIESGLIKIGSVFAAMTELLPATIAEFRHRYPQVEVDIVDLTTAEQIAGLESGALDLGFLHPPVAHGQIKVTPLRQEGFVALLPQDHAIARKTTVTLEDLKGFRLVSQRAALGAHYHNIVLAHCRRAGFQPEFVQESGSTLTVAVLVAAGVGVAILPERARFIALPGVVVRPLPELPRVIEIALASHPGEPSPVIQHFIRAARQIGKHAEVHRASITAP
jgi:DNA-binding transcriptional LysR family regulator